MQAKAFHKQKLKHGVQLDSFYGYLLEGQQRLTALIHLRDGDEKYPLMFYVWPDREAASMTTTFYWRGKKKQDDPWCVPVSRSPLEKFNLGRSTKTN